jgi:hypothetical protein
MKILDRKFILEELNSFFGIVAEEFESTLVWTIVNNNFQDFIILSISNEAGSNSPGLLINLQTSQGIFEMHNCTNYLLVQPDEIFFWDEAENTISCLILSKQATCSIFSNVSKELLKKDISELSPNEILASVQISMIYN